MLEASGVNTDDITRCQLFGKLLEDKSIDTILCNPNDPRVFLINHKQQTRLKRFDSPVAMTAPIIPIVGISIRSAPKVNEVLYTAILQTVFSRCST